MVSDIKEQKFGTDFKGSSPEFVLTCITEQRQVFEGAAHPFYWKPKLRIPDISTRMKRTIKPSASFVKIASHCSSRRKLELNALARFITFVCFALPAHGQDYTTESPKMKMNKI